MGDNGAALVDGSFVFAQEKYAHEKTHQCKWHRKNGMREFDEGQVFVDFFHLL